MEANSLPKLEIDRKADKLPNTEAKRVVFLHNPLVLAKNLDEIGSKSGSNRG